MLLRSWTGNVCELHRLNLLTCLQNCYPLQIFLELVSKVQLFPFDFINTRILRTRHLEIMYFNVHCKLKINCNRNHVKNI